MQSLDSSIRKYVMLSTYISGFIAVGIIGTVLFKTLTTNGALVLPEVLTNWGGIIVGFYFGSFATLIGQLGSSQSQPGNDPEKRSEDVAVKEP